MTGSAVPLGDHPFGEETPCVGTLLMLRPTPAVSSGIRSGADDVYFSNTKLFIVGVSRDSVLNFQLSISLTTNAHRPTCHVVKILAPERSSS